MTDTWPGCYDLSWKDAIVPAAFAHPAKMSRGLLRHILDHAFEQGWVSKGNVVCDPFGGIGSTAIEGAYRGLQVVTCELESKFVTLAKENMALHARHWTTLGCPQPVILQGDSRQLCNVVQGAQVIISSHPYAESDQKYPILPGSHNSQAHRCKSDRVTGYSSTPGQLRAMKAGSVSAILSSPPYAESIDHAPGNKKWVGKKAGNLAQADYGSSPGQLAALPPGSVEAILSSPPYEGASGNPRIGGAEIRATVGKGGIAGRGKHGNTAPYGTSDGQLGQTTGDTFWSAARLIVEQCYQLLPPGGHAVWVCKDFVRNKQRVPFSDDWLRLCEAVGFRLACRHQAMLVKTWEEATLFEGTVTKSRERKSFFRRLAEKKGSPRIDWEDVLCCVKEQRSLTPRMPGICVRMPFKSTRTPERMPNP